MFAVQHAVQTLNGMSHIYPHASSCSGCTCIGSMVYTIYGKMWALAARVPAIDTVLSVGDL